MRRKIVALILIPLFINACQTAVTPAAGPGLVVSASAGNGQIQPGGQGEFRSLQPGEVVHAGDRLRIPAEDGAFIELKDERSLLAFGPDSQAVLSALSADSALTATSMQLEQGGAYAEAFQPLGTGFLEVTTPGGSARLIGSSMLVGLDSTAKQTDVVCTTGSAVVTAGGSSVSLMAGQTTGYTSASVPDKPESLDDRIRRKYPQFQEVIDDRYYHPLIMVEPTITPESPATLAPTRTASATARPTQTVFVLGPTSTLWVDGLEPTRRPTSTAVPGASGLTPEELANQGAFTYAISCRAWNKCVCDSADANPIQTMTISFDAQGVTLAGGPDETLAYPKAAPNLYRLESPELTAEITFLPDGFEFFVLRGGKTCQLQTFTRQP